jgi:hypothetical protein
MKYTVQMASGGMIYVRCFMRIGSGIQVILRLLQRSERLQCSLLLMGRIYEVGH